MPAQNQNCQRQETHAAQQARLTARNGDILAIAQRGNVKIVYYKYNPNSTAQNTSGNTATHSAADETHATQQTGFEFGYIHPTKRRKNEDPEECLGRRGHGVEKSIRQEDVCMGDADADDEDEGEDGDGGDEEHSNHEDAQHRHHSGVRYIPKTATLGAARRRPMGPGVPRKRFHDHSRNYDNEDDEQTDSLEDEDEEMPDYPSFSPTHSIETRREREISRQRVYDDFDVGFDADESEFNGLERGEDVVGEPGDGESDEDDGDGGESVASSCAVEGSERSSHTLGRSERGSFAGGGSEESSQTVRRSDEGGDE